MLSNRRLGRMQESCIASITLRSAAIPAVPSVWPRTVLIEPTNKGRSPASGFVRFSSPKNALLIASASMGSAKAKPMISV